MSFFCVWLDQLKAGICYRLWAHSIVPFVFAADEEFDHLCFEYGIELDDVVSWGRILWQDAAQLVKFTWSSTWIIAAVNAIGYWGVGQEGLSSHASANLQIPLIVLL